MIFVTQTDSMTGRQFVRQMSSKRDAIRALIETVESLRMSGIRVWGSIRDGYETVVNGQLIRFAIE